jgi:hypothetical protein
LETAVSKAFRILNAIFMRRALRSSLGSASQVVPQITPKTKSLTQFIRTPHWIQELANTQFGPGARWAFRNVPLLTRFMRFAIFLWAESNWRLFYLNDKSAKLRRATEKESTRYTLSMAPKKYHEILVPDWEIACKVCITLNPLG